MDFDNLPDEAQISVAELRRIMRGDDEQSEELPPAPKNVSFVEEETHEDIDALQKPPAKVKADGRKKPRSEAQKKAFAKAQAKLKEKREAKKQDKKQVKKKKVSREEEEKLQGL